MPRGVEGNFRVCLYLIENAAQCLVDCRIASKRFGHPLDISTVFLYQLHHFASEQFRDGKFDDETGLCHLFRQPPVIDVFISESNDIRKTKSCITTNQECIAYFVLLSFQCQFFQFVHLFNGQETFLGNHLLNTETVKRVDVNNIPSFCFVQKCPQQPEPADACIVCDAAFSKPLVVTNQKLVVNISN